jgi:hypothetical protein
MGARLEQNVQGSVFGCGLLMDPDNKLTIFFTLNGILLGKFFLGHFMYKLSCKKQQKRPNVHTNKSLHNLLYYIIKDLKETQIYRQTNSN